MGAMSRSARSDAGSDDVSMLAEEPRLQEGSPSMLQPPDHGGSARDHMDAAWEEIHSKALHAAVKNADLGVWNTAVVPRFWVRLVLDLPIASCRPCIETLNCSDTAPIREDDG